MSPEDLQGQVARSAAVERELREEVGKLRAELAEAKHRLAEIEDIDICRLQLPDGRVPGGTVECARMWHAEAQRFWKERDAATARATAAECALADSRTAAERYRKDLEASCAALAEARGALRGLLKLLEDGALVRDTSHDHESGWALKQMGLVIALKRASAAAEEKCGAVSQGHRCEVEGPHTRHVAENAGEGGADYAWEDPPAALARAGEQANTKGSAGELGDRSGHAEIEPRPETSRNAGEQKAPEELVRVCESLLHIVRVFAPNEELLIERAQRALTGEPASSGQENSLGHPPSVEPDAYEPPGPPVCSNPVAIYGEKPLPTPPPGEQGKGADAVADGIALVEGWWRRKCGALQRTHAPNLDSARVDATEVEELLRRMRALATGEPEQDKGGGEGLQTVSVPIDLLRDLKGIALKWWGHAQTKYRDEGGIEWAGEMCAGQTYALASIILRKAEVAPAQPAEHPSRNVIQPAVGPAQDGAGADLSRSGIPLSPEERARDLLLPDDGKYGHLRDTIAGGIRDAEGAARSRVALTAAGMVRGLSSAPSRSEVEELARQVEALASPSQDTPRSGIPLIDHDFQANTWPKRDECDKRVSDNPDGRPSRQCGRPRREHRNAEGGK